MHYMFCLLLIISLTIIVHAIPPLQNTKQKHYLNLIDELTEAIKLENSLTEIPITNTNSKYASKTGREKETKEKNEVLKKPTNTNTFNLFNDCVDKLEYTKNKYVNLMQQKKTVVKNCPILEENTALRQKITLLENKIASQKMEIISATSQAATATSKLQTCKTYNNAVTTSNCTAIENKLTECEIISTQCKTDLNTCKSDLGTCKTTVSNTESKFKTCESDLAITKTCTEQLKTCKTDLATAKVAQAKTVVEMAFLPEDSKTGTAGSIQLSTQLIDAKNAITACETKAAEDLKKCQNTAVAEKTDLQSQIQAEKAKVTQAETAIVNKQLEFDSCKTTVKLLKDTKLQFQSQISDCRSSLEKCNEHHEVTKTTLQDCIVKTTKLTEQLNNNNKGNLCTQEIKKVTDDLIYCNDNLESCIKNVTVTNEELLSCKSQEVQDFNPSRLGMSSDLDGCLKNITNLNKKLNICQQSKRDFITDNGNLEDCLRNVEKYTTSSCNIQGSNVPLIISPFGSIYHFDMEHKTNWYGARDYCRLQGLELITIESENEDIWLKSTIVMKQREIFNSKAPNAIWTGLRKQKGNSPWKWVATGYETYYFDRTSNLQNKTDTDKCLKYLYQNDDVIWRDDVCNAQAGFVCELQIPCP